MNYKVIALTDKGEDNNCNQDSVVVRSAMTKIGHMCMAVICDGLGGLVNGEVASTHTVMRFAEWFMESAEEFSDMKNIVYRAKVLLEKIHEELKAYGKDNGFAMGTTCSVLFICKKGYGYLHVGDTRIYRMLLRTKIITKDHCMGDNVLLQCVGGSDKIAVQTGYGDYIPGIRFVMCSDGFRRKNNISIISSYYKVKNMKSEEEMEKNTRMLIQRGRYLGEKDNMTAIIIKPEGVF